MTTVRECGCWDSSVIAHKHLCRYHEGAEAEQEQIVAWLRGWGKDGTQPRDYAELIAAAIERGEYEKASE